MSDPMNAGASAGETDDVIAFARETGRGIVGEFRGFVSKSQDAVARLYAAARVASKNERELKKRIRNAGVETRSEKKHAPFISLVLSDQCGAFKDKGAERDFKRWRTSTVNSWSVVFDGLDHHFSDETIGIDDDSIARVNDYIADKTLDGIKQAQLKREKEALAARRKNTPTTPKDRRALLADGYGSVRALGVIKETYVPGAIGSLGLAIFRKTPDLGAEVLSLLTANPSLLEQAASHCRRLSTAACPATLNFLGDVAKLLQRFPDAESSEPVPGTGLGKAEAAFLPDHSQVLLQLAEATAWIGYPRSDASVVAGLKIPEDLLNKLGTDALIDSATRLAMAPLAERINRPRYVTQFVPPTKRQKSIMRCWVGPIDNENDGDEVVFRAYDKHRLTVTIIDVSRFNPTIEFGIEIDEFRVLVDEHLAALQSKRQSKKAKEPLLVQFEKKAWRLSLGGGAAVKLDYPPSFAADAALSAYVRPDDFYRAAAALDGLELAAPVRVALDPEGALRLGSATPLGAVDVFVPLLQRDKTSINTNLFIAAPKRTSKAIDEAA